MIKWIKKLLGFQIEEVDDIMKQLDKTKSRLDAAKAQRQSQKEANETTIKALREQNNYHEKESKRAEARAKALDSLLNPEE